MLPKLHYNGIQILKKKTITVIVPLQKFRQKLRKGAITNDHSNGSTSPSRLSTNVTITEKLKNLKFSQKLRYSSDTELINNFDKKSQFRFDCKNTTFCEHHKYKQRCYGFMNTPCRSSFKFGTSSINATKRERNCL